MNEKFRSDIRQGLTSDPKYIPSKYFYDEQGDELFQQIMALDEYYHALDVIDKKDSCRKIILFLGSNIGNFNPDETLEFFGGIYQKLKSGGMPRNHDFMSGRIISTKETIL
ncbi:MAG: L-histidine N(alpha)-methyltransferase [Bacteroidales bacterium]|nr:L-histidine N(alpha)-methyltransferase [Bacteroidales bacterium]